MLHDGTINTVCLSIFNVYTHHKKIYIAPHMYIAPSRGFLPKVSAMAQEIDFFLSALPDHDETRA